MLFYARKSESAAAPPGLPHEMTKEGRLMASVSSSLEYAKAQKLGQKEKKERLDAGLEPYPAVLERILPQLALLSADAGN